MLRIVGGVMSAAFMAAFLVGCSAGGGYAVSVGDRSTLILGWEQHFAIEWTVEPDTPTTRTVRGRVTHIAGADADRMRVLVQASESSGRIVAQHLVWLPTGVRDGASVYFEERGMPAADQYRVTVWDYERFEMLTDFR